jgi:hypothetical protein
LKFIAFDCETGGVLAKECSLLSADFGVYDYNLNQISELPLWVKPNNNEPYNVLAEAMNVNKINLIEHDKIAKTESECGQILYRYLKQESEGGTIKLVPIGHGVVMDIQFVNAHLINKAGWDYFCSYRYVDTAVIGQFLKTMGLIPYSVTGSLGSYAKFFKINPPGALHTAKADRIVTVEVLKAMRALVQKLIDEQKYPPIIPK